MSNSPVWDGSSQPGFSRLEADVDADVCVVGLGGSGLACVLELLAHGAHVIGLDASTVASGAAGRNGGFLLAGLPDFYHKAVQRFGRNRASAIYRRTLNEVDRITLETPLVVRRSGSLRVADSDEEFADCEAQFTAMQRDNLPVEFHDGSEGRGLLLPSDAAFDPMARCRALAAKAREAGARLFERSPAIDFSGDMVRTPEGTVRCRRTIVAVDGRLERLIPELGGRVRSARLQMLATAPTSEVRIARPVYSRWGYDYWQQLPDGRIALGGCRDTAGESEWTDVAVPTAAVQSRLDALLRTRVGVAAPVTHRWAGVVGFSESGLPIVERVRPDLWAIGGYSGTGNVLGAICGRGVAQLALTGHSELLSELLVH